MKRAKGISLLAALLAGVGLGGAAVAVWYHLPGTEQPAPDTVQTLYQEAIRDAVVAEENEIFPLVEITEESGLVTWKESRDSVLMLTFHDSPDTFPAGETIPLQGEAVWVFSEKEFLSRYPGYGAVKDWNLRMNQLLGLPADSGLTHVTAMWVSPEQLLRPAYVTDVTGQMRNSFSEDSPEDPAYVAWFNANAVYSYCENTYPWTRLGYTYDWADNGEEYGVSEFLIKEGAEVTVEFTMTLEEFISWADAQTR